MASQRLKQNNRALKKRIWTAHRDALYRRSVDRKWSDPTWGISIDQPVPGRLLAASKVRA